MKKKIIAFGPVMPQESEIEAIASTLSFLHKDYQIDFIDPLSIHDDLANEDYYRLWENEIEKYLDRYDIFFGFSFGGVILEQCFRLFAGLNKSIVLFSTPTFADKALAEKLGTVVDLCKKNQVIKALNFLYKDVFYPNKAPQQFTEVANEALVASRLIFGLERVLASNSTTILSETTVDHLHLIGEYSNLVNQANVMTPKTGRLAIVPGAGMRVLQDNPDFCQKIILDQLGSLRL
jgi:pimeloyl-ACP methyl ester carboxylesterase